MPLFGKKKQANDQQKAQPGPAYPRAAYPAQPTAPGATYQQPGAPPPYTPAAGAPLGYPGAPRYASQPVFGGQPGYPGYQPYAQPMMPQFAPGTHVVAQGTYDAGARFNGGASQNVPPPPPGCMPNAAQVASAYGGTVHMNQGRAGFFTTSSDGGISTHID